MTPSLTSLSASAIFFSVSLSIPGFHPLMKWLTSLSKSWLNYCLSSRLRRNKLCKDDSVSSPFDEYLPMQDSMRGREIREETVGRERGRVRFAEVGQINSGRGSDDCGTDPGRRPWTCGKYENCHGRCAIISWNTCLCLVHYLSH